MTVHGPVRIQPQGRPGAGGPARQPHEAAHARRGGRTGAHHRPRQASVQGHPRRQDRLPHLVRPSGHREDDDRAGHRQHHPLQVRPDQRHHRGQEGHGGRRAEGEGRPRHGGAQDHPLRGRDPPLQQGAAGLPAPVRGGRHRDPHRRHHGEPLLRGQPRAGLPLPHLRAEAAVPAGPREAPEEGAVRPREGTGEAERRRGRRRHLVPGRHGQRGRPRRAERAGAGRPDHPPEGGRQGPYNRGGRLRVHPAQDSQLRPRRGQPLRHDIRVHQEHARIGPGRGGVLSGEDAVRRRGRPVHRPQDHDMRRGGRRQRRPPGAHTRRIGIRGRGAHRDAGIPDHTLPGGGVRGVRPQEQLGDQRHNGRDGIRQDGAHQRRPRPSEGRALRQRQGPGPRGRIPLPPQLPQPLHRPAVSARRAGGQEILRAFGQRLRARHEAVAGAHRQVPEAEG